MSRNNQQDTELDPWAATSEPDPSSAQTAPDAADSSDPWGSAADTGGADADPWGGAADSGSDWLDAAPADTGPAFDWANPFDHSLIPFDSWVTDAINWIVLHFRPVFQGIRVPIDFVLTTFEQGLTAIPAPIAILIFALLAWQMSGKGLGL